MVYEHTNSRGEKYYLHTKSGRLYYFKKEMVEADACNLPKTLEVMENPRNGLPMVRRKKDVDALEKL